MVPDWVVAVVSFAGLIGFIVFLVWFGSKGPHHRDFIDGAQFTLAIALLCFYITSPPRTDIVLQNIMRYGITAYILYSSITSFRKRLNAQTGNPGQGSI